MCDLTDRPIGLRIRMSGLLRIGSNGRTDGLTENFPTLVCRVTAPNVRREARR
jgi:hypothetical protein